MKKGFVCGVFDMFHPGHVLMLQECKAHCDYLIVAINKAENIDYSINPGKMKPLFDFEERKMVMESCALVDEVAGYNSEEELENLMRSLQIDIRFLGDDYRGKPITGADLSKEVYYTDRSHGLSTSGYKKRLFELMQATSGEGSNTP